MQAFGAEVEQLDAGTWRVQPTGYKATDFVIEPDASAATYLWAAEVLTGGKIDLGVPSDAFTQPDAAAQAVIAQFPEYAGGDRRLADAGRGADHRGAGGLQQSSGALRRHRQSARQGMRPHFGALDRAQPHPARAWRAKRATIWWSMPIRLWQSGAAQCPHADRNLCRSPHRHELCPGRPQDRRHHHSRPGLRGQDLSRPIGTSLRSLGVELEATE